MNKKLTTLLLTLTACLALSAQNYFTVVIFSDPHLALTGHDGTSIEQMQTYVNNICGMGRPGGKRIIFPAAPDYVPTADLVMCLGDMDGDSKDDHNDFETVMGGFGNAGIPFITMAGNHDYVPDYWTGDNGDEGHTGGDSGGVADDATTKHTVDHFKEWSAQLGCEDVYTFSDGSGHRQPDCFTFRFRGVRFYCGQTYWFQKGYTVNKIMGYVTGLDKMYAPDALINTLESFAREHASEPSIWTQHYPFLAGSDCDRWWLDQSDVGRYIKTTDWSEYGTNDDLGKWTDDANARAFATKKKDKLASIINLTKNPIHFSGHTHRWAYNEYNGVRDYTVSSTGYSETPGAAYVVLCQEGVGTIQVLKTQFNTNTPHVEGQLGYLENVFHSQFLCAGNAWGTQASLGDVALPLYFEQLPNGTYTIDTGINNGGDSHYLGWSELYCDQPAVGWTLEETSAGSGTYLLTTDNKNYLYGATKNKGLTKNATSTVKTNQHAQWRRLSHAQMLERFAAASPANPVDASFLIACPDFGRNDTRFGAWDGGPVLGGPDASSSGANQCAERWNLNFDVNQIIAGVPNGVYRLTCQGFYRAGGTGTTATDRNAYLYANDVETPLMNILDGGKRTSGSGYTTKAGNIYVPNTMADASTAFTANGYTANELLVTVTDNRLRLGIRKSTLIGNDWTIFDRFRLTYLGTKDVYDGIDAIPLNSPPSTLNPASPTQPREHSEHSCYDLAGRRITPHPSALNLQLPHGIYILNGKKIVR